MADDHASRADLDRVATFLRELDRMLHPASTRPSGGYRLAPMVLPPLPPTGGFGDAGRGSGRGGSGWMTTREPTLPPVPGPVPDIPWVEPPVADDVASLPPVAVASAAPDLPVERRVPATPPAPPVPPPVPRAPAAPAESTRPRPMPVPEPAASPVPTREAVGPHAEPTGTVEPAPGPAPVVDGPTIRAAPTAALPPPETRRPQTQATLQVPDATPGPVLARPAEPGPRASTAPDPGPTLRPRSRAPAGPDAGELRRTTPLAAPEPARPSEPVDLVVEGIDAAPTPGSDAGIDADLPAEPADDAVPSVSGPPVPPAGRGPRRERARLSFATAGRVQTELERMYLDRTLRRFR